MYNSESRSRLSGMIRFPSPGTGKAHGGLNVGVVRPAGHGLVGSGRGRKVDDVCAQERGDS